MTILCISICFSVKQYWSFSHWPSVCCFIVVFLLVFILPEAVGVQQYEFAADFRLRIISSKKTHRRLKRMLFLSDKTRQDVNFWGNPLFQSYIQYENKQFPYLLPVSLSLCVCMCVSALAREVPLCVCVSSLAREVPLCVCVFQLWQAKSRMWSLISCCVCVFQLWQAKSRMRSPNQRVSHPGTLRNDCCKFKAVECLEWLL